MKVKNLLNVFLLVISVSWAANAYLIPGLPGGGGQPAPYPGGGHPHQPPGGGGRPHEPRPPYNPPQPPPYNPPSSPYPGNPGYPSNPSYPSDPYPGNPNYGSDVKTIYIGQNVVNQTLDLRQLAGIDRQYAGWQVVSVRANTRPNSQGRTVVQLLGDGRVVATQVNPGYQIHLVPEYSLVLGQSVRSLQLAIGGGTYIESIEIELRQDGNGGGGGYNPQPPSYDQNVDISIYRSVRGNDRVDLTQYMDLQRYRGRVITQVIITGRAQYNSSFVSLLINGNNMGQIQYSGGYSQQGTLWLNQQMVIGQGADSLVLYTQGDMTVERVTLVLR